MATPVLEATAREAAGKIYVSKERKNGRVPAILYSRGKETEKVFLNEKELEKILTQYGAISRVGLDYNGERLYAVIKDIQREAIKQQLLHVDLQRLNENERVRLTMPIQISNKEAVETSSQIVQLLLSEVEIYTYPRYLPERVEIDARILKNRDTITFADLNIAANENIEILEDKNTIIASLVYTTQM
jgi:large subunit ribosomal protein L25